MHPKTVPPQPQYRRCNGHTQTTPVRTVKMLLFMRHEDVVAELSLAQYLKDTHSRYDHVEDHSTTHVSEAQSIIRILRIAVQQRRYSAERSSQDHNSCQKALAIDTDHFLATIRLAILDQNPSRCSWPAPYLAKVYSDRINLSEE